MKKLLLCFLALFYHQIMYDKKQQASAETSIAVAHQSTPDETKTIIVMLDTIFYPDEAKIEQEIRKKIGIGKGIGILFSGVPSKEEAKDEFFAALDDVPLAKISVPNATWQTPYVEWEDEYKYPPILNQSLIAATSKDKKTIKEVINHKLRRSRKFKKAHHPIIQASIDYTLDTQLILNTLSKDEHMMSLLKKLKDEGYQLILVAGMSGATWDAFIKSYEPSESLHEIFANNDIYISGKEQKLPTSPALFDKIIKQHHLNPSHIIVIGDNKHNLAYPEKQGMITFVYDPEKSNFSHLEQKIQHALALPGAV